MALGEFELIERILRRPQDRQRGRVALGIGDDCALLAVQPGEQWAVSTDTLVEGRHFLPTVDPGALGHKALAVNLSDLAACGAQPQAFTLNLTLPSAQEPWLRAFAQGLHFLADEHGIVLAGGDTTAGPLSVTITALGTVPTGLALLRSGAQSGDDLWVSHPVGGGLGDARIALEVFRGRAGLDRQGLRAVVQRMERPDPRVALGVALRGIAHAAIDLSDGLTGDLGHLLRCSGVSGQVWWSSLPRSGWVTEQPQALQLEAVLAGGDDYELLVSVPARRRPMMAELAASCGVGLTRIGRVGAGSGLEIFDTESDAASGVGAWGSDKLPHSHDHFRAAPWPGARAAEGER